MASKKVTDCSKKMMDIMQLMQHYGQEDANSGKICTVGNIATYWRIIDFFEKFRVKKLIIFKISRQNSLFLKKFAHKIC